MDTNSLDTNAATPLYSQLKNKLQEEIDLGLRKPGSKLPTEFELSKEYGISRVTVRKALAELTEQGYLERKSGKGSFVAQKKIQKGLSGELMSFSKMCESMGLKPGAKTIKIALEEPSSALRERMGLAEDSRILVLERIRYADNEPVMLEINIFPESFDFLFSENLNNQSLFEILKNKHNIVMSNSHKTIQIVFSDQDVSKKLNLSKGYPLMRIDSELSDANHRFVNISTQLCIGDKFKLTV